MSLKKSFWFVVRSLTFKKRENNSLPKAALLSFCVVLFSFLFSYSQDTHFSQFDFSPLQQNAAHTGGFDGDYRFTAIHRNQYKSVTIPYKTFSFSFDENINVTEDSKKFWSAGILFNTDKAGDGDFKTLELGLSVAYNYFLDAYKKQLVTVALQPGIAQHSINFDNLYFDSQYNGDTYDPNIVSGEKLERTNYSYFDLNIGANYFNKLSDGVDISVGLGLSHINNPNQSFYSEKNPLGSRFTAELLSKIKITEVIYLHPQLLFYNQNKFQQLNGGGKVQFVSTKNESKQYSLSVGGYVRAKDAAIARVGVGYNNLDVGFAYDFNSSDLKRASKGKGAYELGLIYIIKKVKPLKKHPPCPVY